MISTNKIKARIVELGMAHNEVADYMGIDRSTLNLKLNNKRRTYLDEVVKLCKILNITSAEQLKEYFNLNFLILPTSHENETKVEK